jgi:hypothetical protein
LSRALGCVASIFVAGALLAASATGATFTVTNTNESGAGSLREAVKAANTAAGDDTIVFALDGTPEPTIQLAGIGFSVVTNITILNDRPGDVPVTVRVNVEPSFLYPAFDVTSSGRLVMSGLIITGPPPGRLNQSSGIRNLRGYLALRNCTLIGNNGTQGGGVYNTGQAILTNCLITKNRAALEGGGLYNNGGRMTVQHCVISDNTAVWSGGGIYNAGLGYLSLIDSIVSDNTTTDSFANTQGGAGLLNGALAGLSNCTFSNNRVDAWGGGAIYTIGSLTADKCTFVNNKGQFGGAIWDNGSTTRPSVLSNCTFSGNTVTDGGPAVYANYQYVTTGKAKLTINNCTFSENFVIGREGQPTSIGSAILAAGANTKVEVSNTVFRKLGSSSNLYPPAGGGIISRGHNLTDDPAGGDGGTGPGGILNAPGDIRNTDPLLAPLADNGGATMTHALSPGSPAIDAGDIAAATPRDQRGNGRQSNSDIGSYEFGGAPSATRLANISTRAKCLTGENAMIAGFIITGQEDKKVLVRAIGPSLPGSTHLNNPILELHDASGAGIALNDDWNDASNRQDIIASSIAPTHNLESAILITLAPGAYTAVVRGANNTSGIALAEVYDLDPRANSRIANISTRSFVQTGDNVMIGGFIIAGPEAQTVAVRAMGPSLPVERVVPDPGLELRDVNGILLGAINGWLHSEYEGKIVAAGLAPLSDAESVLITTLAPGQYTAIVKDYYARSGVGLVEMYALD